MTHPIEDEFDSAELDALQAGWNQKELERRQKEEAPEISEEEWQSLIEESKHE